MIAAASATSTQPTEQLQAQYLELVPRLQSYAYSYFGYVHCPHKRADKVQESLALGWKHFLRLNEQGKDVTEFPDRCPFHKFVASWLAFRLYGRGG